MCVYPKPLSLDVSFVVEGIIILPLIGVRLQVGVKLAQARLGRQARQCVLSNGSHLAICTACQCSVLMESLEAESYSETVERKCRECNEFTRVGWFRE